MFKMELTFWNGSLPSTRRANFPTAFISAS